MPALRKLLLIALFSLFSTTSYAGTITLGTISADATAAGFNDNYTTIGNAINGNIEGSTDSGASVSNIKADSVFEINMANNANSRVFAAELLAIGSDSVSAGTLTQNTVVESGCVPADDTDLTSDVSACVAYVNGYRVSKSATSLTYTASRDNYVDLSDTGSYTVTAVSNGATQPAVTSNSIRLAKVVTDGTEITTITSVFTTRIPGLIISSNYRDKMLLSRDTTTVIKVMPGAVEINNTMLTKTEPVSLTITTAGDYAGGSSLAAANTTGFVGIDDDGNIKLHTTAPTHSDYAVSNTSDTKRYATWSSVVYRILGWYRMNASTQLDSYGVGNLVEHGIRNFVSTVSSDVGTTAATIAVDNSIPQSNEGAEWLKVGIKPTAPGNLLRVRSVLMGTSSSVSRITTALFRDSTADALTATAMKNDAADAIQMNTLEYAVRAGSTNFTEFKIRAAAVAGTFSFNGEAGARVFGGVSGSTLSVEEIEAQ